MFEPITRIEHFLSAVSGSGECPSPITRVEYFLGASAGVCECPEPITRLEMFLAAAAGNGEAPEPITRLEFFLGAVSGKCESPEPITRIEYFLKDWAEGGGSYITKVIEGNAPLTFTAVAAALVSLIQYGKTEQASTPTPSAPVDIVCNNGKIAMVDDDLQSGYKRLLGISFDGNFHYETGEYLTSDDDVTMTLDNLSSSGKNVFGSYNGANGKNFSLYIYGSTSGSYFRFGDQLKRPKYGDTGRRTITFGKSGTSGFADDVDVDPDDFTTPANTYIGMLPNSSSAAYSGDIVGNILVSNRLEWIPCERESDGVIGYYEKYNGNFLEPVGGGTPVSLGYDSSHLVLDIVGTPEVLSLGTQTASVQNLFAIGDYADTQNIISGAITRKVGVKVLTGNEEWTAKDQYKRVSIVADDMSNPTSPRLIPAICTHYENLHNGEAISTITAGQFYTAAPKRLYFHISEASTAEFTAYLAAQYAAGTPVIVLYPLAEEQTETVAGQSLRTKEGSNTVSAVAEVTVPLKVEYKDEG